MYKCGGWGGKCWILTVKSSWVVQKNIALPGEEQPRYKEDLDFKKSRSSPSYVSSYYITGNSTSNECRK